MALQMIHIKNLSVFSDVTIHFAGGLNVLVGPNGTGKTQLLKMIYGCLEVRRENNPHAFVDCFQLDGEQRTLIRNPEEGTGSIVLQDDQKRMQGYGYDFNFQCDKENPDSESIKDSVYHFDVPYQVISSVYIPVKDMLTHSRGLLAMGDRYREFPFDKTLLDIISQAERWNVKKPPELVQKLAPTLEQRIHGKIVVDNDEFYIQQEDGRRVSFELEAEGFKKLGTLWQLLMNESVARGTVLLWDEPEANLNPEFIPVVADCLLELARSGVQVMISTHSYILAKYLEIRKKPGDAVAFHSLYEAGEGVSCETGDSFSGLKHNVIISAFDQLMEEVYGVMTGGSHGSGV